MHDTLSLFDELLEHDSGSRIFFPLAKLYAKHGNHEKAISIVRKGIAVHPDYLEAQLLLVALLHEKQEYDEAEVVSKKIFDKLNEYQSFWSSLRSFFSKNECSQLSLASFLFEKTITNASIDFFSIINAGLLNITEDVSSAGSSLKEPFHDLDAEEVTQICINSGIKTKTMAKLLMAQGEFAQAADIYGQLIAEASESAEQKELAALREEALAQAGGEGEDQGSVNERLYSLLDTLAFRLEQR